jgi:hypothetical protein
MSRKLARKQLTGEERLRREIKILEAIQRRGGITLVMVDDQLITVYRNGRKAFR